MTVTAAPSSSCRVSTFVAVPPPGTSFFAASAAPGAATVRPTRIIGTSRRFTAPLLFRERVGRLVPGRSPDSWIRETVPTFPSVPDGQWLRRSGTRRPSPLTVAGPGRPPPLHQGPPPSPDPGRPLFDTLGPHPPPAGATPRPPAAAPTPPPHLGRENS